MKRVIAVCLSLLLVFGLGISVYADVADSWYQQAFEEALKYNDRYEDAEYTQPIPVYVITRDTDPLWGYAQIMGSGDVNCATGVIRDGEMAGELHFQRLGNGWKMVSSGQDKRVGYYAQQGDIDVLLLKYSDHCFVVFPEETNTLYPIEQFLDGDCTDPVPYEYTLTEFVMAATFRSVQPFISETKYSEYEVTGYNDELIEVASDYWINKPIRERNFYIGFWIVVPLTAIGLVTLAVVLNKRRKQREAKEVSRE